MRKKVYGQSKVDSCPFCGSRATAKNAEGAAVCRKHVNLSFGNLKCLCGEWLEPRESKWGAYFLCRNCGPQSLRKILEMNPDATKPKREEKKETKKSEPKKREEIVVRSDDPIYFG